MSRWAVVGYYHKLNIPWGSYWGPGSLSAMAALRAAIEHAHLSWTPERQITVCAVVQGTTIHDFGLVRSDDPATWPKGMQEAGSGLRIHVSSESQKR
jgi:hypothetical protein